MRSINSVFTEIPPGNSISSSKSHGASAANLTIMPLIQQLAKPLFNPPHWRLV